MKASVIAALMAMFSYSAAAEAPKGEPVKLDLYVMSQCPFGTKAEDFIFPAVKSLGEHVDFNLYFIVNEPAPLTFQSLHGQPEVDENIRHLCAMKHFPKEYMDFILERNLNIHSTDWQSAAKKVGIDIAKMESCSTGEEGKKLLSESAKFSTTREARGSPTIDVNGAPYTGPRGQRSITLAVCDALKAKGRALPDACQKAEQMPPDPAPAGRGPAPAKPAAAPIEFEVGVVNDKTCLFCKTSNMIDAIKRNHPGAKIVEMDVDSTMGRSFIEKHDIRFVPFYFFEGKIEKDPNFATMKGYYTKKGDGYVMKTGPDTYSPGVRLDRPRVPGHLDVFVESNSQFTAQVEAQLMKFLAESDVKDLTFSIHYIVQETAKAEPLKEQPEKSHATDVRAASLGKEMGQASAGPLTSRRGEAELQESMRQVCLFQHAPMGTFFTYLTCRNQNILDASRGETCLEMTEPIQKCLSGPEAEKLLRQDARLARELDITAGPVLLWENRYGPFGWYEVDWKEMIAESKK